MSISVFTKLTLEQKLSRFKEIVELIESKQYGLAKSFELIEELSELKKLIEEELSVLSNKLEELAPKITKEEF